MSRDHAVISAKDILLWFLLGLNVIVLLTAILTDLHWFWALSVTNSLAILVRYSKRRKRHTDEEELDELPGAQPINDDQFQSKHTA